MKIKTSIMFIGAGVGMTLLYQEMKKGNIKSLLKKLKKKNILDELESIM